jgi:hypothetical protein
VLIAQFIEQPAEGLDDPARLDAQRNMHPSVRLVAKTDGSGHADREEAVALQSLAALLE